MSIRNQPQRPTATWVTVVRWAVVLALLGFIGRSLIESWDELKEAQLHFDTWLLVSSVLVLVLFMVGQALIWHRLTEANRVAIPLPRAIAAWFYSQLGKYIPGKVFLYLGRLHFYVREGRSAAGVSIAFGIETMGTLAASIVVVLVAALTVDVPELEPYRPFLIAALLALLVALHPRLIEGLVRLVARVLHRQPFQVPMSYIQVLGYVGLYVLNWALLGGALFLFIRSFYLLDLSSITYVTGALALAGTLGIIAVFAPSGLGVREAVLALFLNQVMPTPVALLVSITTRVWLTVVELGCVGLVYLMIRFRWLEAGEPGSLRSAEDGVEGEV